MGKISLNKPLLIMLYGFPAAGKTALAHNLSEHLQMAHLQADKIRSELFTNPTYSERETAAINRVMNYLCEELLRAGIGVIYDTNASQLGVRRSIRELASSTKAKHLTIWLQIDEATAFARTQQRDRRKSEDKYAASYTRESFDKYLAGLQNPLREDYVVISGKHTFNTQKAAIIQKLHTMGLIDSASATSREVKPQLVNRVPNFGAGRVDASRRNIAIR